VNPKAAGDDVPNAVGDEVPNAAGDDVPNPAGDDVPNAAGDDVPKVGTVEEDPGIEEVVTDGILKIGFEFVPTWVSDACCGVPKPL